MDCDDLNIGKNRSYDEELEAAEDEQRRHAELEKLLDVAINITDFMSDHDDSDTNYSSKNMKSTNETTDRSFYREYTTNYTLVEPKTRMSIAQHPYLTNQEEHDETCKKITKEKSNRIISVAPSLSVSSSSIIQKEALDIFDNQHIKDLYEARVDEVLSLQIELQNIKEVNNKKNMKISSLQDNVTKLTESISSLESTSKELVGKLKGKDQELEKTKARLEEVQRDLIIATATIENLQHEIVQHTIETKEIPFTQIKEIQRPKDEEIRRLHALLSEKDEEVARLKLKIKEKDAALEEASVERIENVVSFTRKLKDLEQSAYNPIGLAQVFQEKEIMEARMKILQENLSKAQDMSMLHSNPPSHLNYNLILDELKRSLHLIEQNCVTIKNLQSRNHEDAATIEKLRGLLAKEVKNSSTNVSQIDMKNSSIQNTLEDAYIGELHAQNESLTRTIKTLQNYETKYQQQIQLLQNEFDINLTEINDLKTENLELQHTLANLKEKYENAEKLKGNLKERDFKIEALEEKIRKRNEEYLELKKKLRETEEEFQIKLVELERDKTKVEQENVRAIKELVELRYTTEKIKENPVKLEKSTEEFNKKIDRLNEENAALKQENEKLHRHLAEAQERNETFASKILKQSKSLKDLASVNQKLLVEKSGDQPVDVAVITSASHTIKKLQSLNNKLIEKLHKGKQAIVERNAKLMEQQNMIQLQKQKMSEIQKIFSEETHKKIDLVFSRIHTSKKSEIVSIIRNELEQILHLTPRNETPKNESHTSMEKFWTQFAENSKIIPSTTEQDEMNTIIDSQLLIIKKIKALIESGNLKTLICSIDLVDNIESIYNSFNEYVARYFYLRTDKQTLENQYEKMAGEYFQLQRERCNDETEIHNLRLKDKLNSFEIDLLQVDKMQMLEKVKNLEQRTTVQEMEDKGEFLQGKIHQLESLVSTLKQELNTLAQSKPTPRVNCAIQTDVFTGDLAWKNVLKKQKNVKIASSLKKNVAPASGLVNKRKVLHSR